MTKVVNKVGLLVIPFNNLSNNLNKVGTVSSHFGVWPSRKPIVTDARGADSSDDSVYWPVYIIGQFILLMLPQKQIKLIAMSKGKD